YAALNASALMLNSFSERPRAVLSELRLLLQSNLSDTNKLDNYRKAGDQLDKVFDTIRAVVGTMKTTPNDFLLRSYLNSLGDLDLYLESRNTLSIKKEEFRDSLYKLFAVVAGSVMASCYMLGSKQKSDDSLLLTLDAILSEGV
ncbi:MAG: hypothetical protein ACETWD_02295, partial [Desulfatiglandales bacterium]